MILDYYVHIFAGYAVSRSTSVFHRTLRNKMSRLRSSIPWGTGCRYIVSDGRIMSSSWLGGTCLWQHVAGTYLRRLLPSVQVPVLLAYLILYMQASTANYYILHYSDDSLAYQIDLQVRELI